jgi:hypothetical protein
MIVLRGAGGVVQCKRQATAIVVVQHVICLENGAIVLFGLRVSLRGSRQ